MYARRSLLNFAAAIASSAVAALSGLVATPWLLAWVGEDRFGAYRMATDWYGYLTLMELGLGGALLPLMARAWARGDARVIRGTLAVGLRAYLRVTIATLLIGLALATIVTRLVPVGPEHAADLRRAWLVGLLGLLPMVLTPYRAVLEASQRSDRISLLLTVQGLIITGSSLLLAWAGWGITGLSLAATFGAWAFYLVVARIGLRALPERTGLPPGPEPDLGRELWSLSVPALLLDVGGRIGLLSDNLVLGLYLGPASVATLIVTVKLVGLAQAQLLMIGSASWASLAALHARGEEEAFRARLVELTSVVALLGLAVLAPIVAYNRHFLALWVGPGLDGGDAVVVVAAANTLVQAILSLWNWCFGGTGKVRQMVVPYMAVTALNLAASVALTPRLGLVGPLLGTLLAGLLAEFWYLPVMLRRTFGVAPAALIRAVAVPLAWGVPYAAGLWWIARNHRPWGWVGLAAEMGGAAVVFLGLGAYAILGPSDRARWRRRLADFWPGIWGGAASGRPDIP